MSTLRPALTVQLTIEPLPTNTSTNINATIQKCLDDDSLVAALTHAGLVETLQGDGPFTVFAPTDAAFTAAGIDLSNFNTDEANETLVDILKYHVLSGAVDAANVTLVEHFLFQLFHISFLAPSLHLYRLNHLMLQYQLW